MEAIDKFNRRLVKVTKTHADEAKELLQLMGIPYIDVSICVINVVYFIDFLIVFFYYLGALRSRSTMCSFGKS